MTKFVYKAKSAALEAAEGIIDADSQEEAVNKLTKIGFYPFFLGSQETINENRFSFKKISDKEISVFTQQLSNLLESRVNIIKAFNIISQQAPNKNIRILIAELLQRIKDGSSFSQSLAAYPKIFSSFYISMIRTGEAGGKLEETLNKLNSFLNKRQAFKTSLIEALIYPAFVSLVSFITIIVLVAFVIPSITGIFADLGQSLPLPTRILILISQGLKGSWWLFLASVSASIIIFKRFYRQEKERNIVDRLILKIPAIGNIVFKQQISRIFNTLSILMSSGMALLESLDISTSSSQNSYLKDEFLNYKKKIAAGASFSKCLEDSGIFSPFIISVVVIGEETGTLEKSLSRIGQQYENEVEQSLRTFSKMLEPVIILFMGIVVGFIVLSMLLPIFEINLMVN